MSILFPPVLEAQGLAFPFHGQDAASYSYPVRFQMPIGTEVNDIKHIQVSIKYLTTGESAVNKTYSPDHSVLYIAADSDFFEQESTGNYVVKIPYYCFGGGFPAMNTEYLIQVRFGSSTLWSGAGTGLTGNTASYVNFSAWRLACTSAVPTTFGEWSNLMKTYCYLPATTEIYIDFDDFVPRIKWKYTPGQGNDDPVEQIKMTYWYQTMEGTEMKSDVFTGQYMGDNIYTFVTKLPIAPIYSIQVSIDAVTKHNAKYNQTRLVDSLLGKYSFIGANFGDISDIEFSAPEAEDGAIGKKIKLPQDLKGCKNFNVYRINTLTTECIKIVHNQEIVSNEEISFKDYTCEMGEDYQYVAILTKDEVCKYYLNDLVPYGDMNPGYARLTRMDSSFLVSKAHQLRIQGNVQLSGFKRNTQDNFQTTIGSKYPFYSRTSAMNYRTFQLSGLITINFDPTSSFLRLDAIGNIDFLQKLSYDQYQVLVEKSPGVKEFFVQSGVDAEKKPVYTFVGSRDIKKMSPEESKNLVNRCAANLALNGLWWDEDDGTKSSLWIQDRDLFNTMEISLSRRRDALFRNGGHTLSVLNNENPVDTKGPKTVYDRYLHRQTGLDYGTVATDSLVFIERKFREKVMEWLSDGKPKLFRSETEGNMIVMVSGVSFTPFDKTNRMVYSMSCTITEIAEYNTENLMKYNLIPSAIRSVYVDNSIYEYTWGQPDPGVGYQLNYKYIETFRIGNLPLNSPDSEIFIDTKPGVSNGTAPYTFSASGLPEGLNVWATDKFDANGVQTEFAGVIHGYPVGVENVSPGMATLTVVDAEGKTDSMQVPYGWMYIPMVPNGTINLASGKIVEGVPKATLDIGEPIVEVDANDYFSGGVAPYSFSQVDFPSGINIDNTTGKINGAYSNDVLAGTSSVIVKDGLGNTIEIPVSYIPGVFPLTFIKLSDFDYDYTEVNVWLKKTDFNLGVGGGTPPYVFTGSILPEGWKISQGLPTDLDENGNQVPSGVLYGKPEKSHSSGEIEITVTDAVGTKRSITITYNTILEEFIFGAWPEKGLPIEALWILSTPQGQLEPNEITLGTVLGDGYDASKYVRGGLPFTNGGSSYRFEAVGLLPNWHIDKNWGTISGRAGTSVDKHEAVLTAIDARGEKRECIIKVGKVVGGLEFVPGGYNFNDLYVGSQVTTWDNAQTPIPTTTVITDKRQPPNSVGAIVLGDIKNGNAPFSVTGQGFPPGIRITYVPAGPGVPNPFWRFTGAPTVAGPARSGWLQITDVDGKAIQVPVDFSSVTSRLNWDNFEVPLVISGMPNQQIERTNLGISGGKPKYTVTISGNAAAYIQLEMNSDDPSNWKLKVQMPPQQLYNQSAIVTVTDGEGTVVTRTVTIKTTSIPLNLTKLLDFKDVTTMANHGVFDVPVMKITGGEKPYRITRGALINGNAGIGLSLVIVDDTVYCRGTPTMTKRINTSVSPYFEIEDSTTPNSQKIMPTFDWFDPKVVPMPKINTSNKSYNADDNKFIQGGIIFNTYFQSEDYIQDIEFPGYKITEQGKYPQGIYGKVTGTSYVAMGQSISQTVDDTTVKVIIETPATNYDSAFTLETEIVFGAIMTIFDYSKVPGDLAIPGLGQNVPMARIVVSDGLSGGTGDFSWEAAGLPAGLILVQDPTNKRVAWIEGTPTQLAGQSVVTISVTDNGQNVKKQITIPCYGVYAPIIKIKDIVIPEKKVNEPITPINVDDCFSGGTGPFRYYAEGLEQYGYSIDDSTGIISGNASPTAMPAGTGTVTVRDENLQEITINVNIGKIDGPLDFLPGAAGVNTRIPEGDIGTEVPEADRPILTNGATGGTAPYAFSEHPTEGWTQAGFTCTMNAQGVFTAMTRPTVWRQSGSFKVKLTDAVGASVDVEIYFGKVIDPDNPNPPSPWG